MSSSISQGASDLSDKKKALFKRLQKEAAARLSQQQRASSATQMGISRRTDRSVYPLSLAQQRLWWLEQLTPGDPGLRVMATLHLSGSVNPGVLQQSLQTLIQRHELLRAVFANLHGTPVQTILPTMSAELICFDLSSLEPETLQEAQEQVPPLRQRHSFDLVNGPLYKVTLIQLANAEYVLTFSLHAILADDATLVLLCRELMQVYSSFTRGEQALLPELALSYADYASWQHDLPGDLLEEQLAYWKQQLAGASLGLNLPFDYQRPASPNPREASYTLELDRSLVRQARSFCEQEGIALPDLLSTVFSLLLSQYTAQTDILLGFLSPNRAPELATLAGNFANLLPLGVQISEELTGHALLHQVQQTRLNATRHQDLPLVEIVKAVYPQHDLTRIPLFQVSLAFHDLPAFSDLPSGLFVDRFSLAPSLSLEDLTLHFQSCEQDLGLTVVYNSDLLASESIIRFLQHYQQLLLAFVQHPAKPLSALSCLTPSERECLLHGWNVSLLDQSPAPDRCLHHFFEEQVRRTPRAIALSDGNQQLTYEQLNRQANQLAHLLIRRGIGPDDLVGLCLSRSFDLIIGLLAILKAGAAYVPLDPAYPAERLAFTMQDANLALVLTQQDLLTQMPFSIEQALCLDLPTLSAGEDTDNLALTMSNEHLAYVIYTSGSTGRPKGVCITHRSVAVFLTWVREQFSDAELAGVLFGTSICFDISLFELFAPLSWGGKVILASTVLDLPLLAASEEITLLNTVPSAAAALLANTALPSSIITVNLAGEALTRDLVQTIYQQPYVRRVCNLYGPTEDTIYSTWTEIGPHEQGAMPIGRPLANTEAYIVDTHMQLVPVGIAGELYLGGDGQARGYLNRPDLTAERFVPDPFSTIPGRRLYGTGDLARYRADGTIVYLGRLDHQVKIRGFRIELGEIETQLRQHPAVMDAVVVASEEQAGEKRLLAYVVAQPLCSLEISTLRQYLLDIFPAYMLPAFFILLDRLPQTVNGKVDRKALPKPDAARVSADLSPREMPQGKRERWLALLWQEVLQVTLVGRTDNFFAIGGDSLRVMQLLARLQNDFQLQISLADLFAAPTIAHLAERLQTVTSHTDLEPIVPTQNRSIESDTPLPLALGQQRLWFADQLETGTAMYNVPLSLALRGPLNRLALHQALYEIIRRHEPLRTAVRVLKGRPFLFVADLPTPDLSLVDLAIPGDLLTFADLYNCPDLLREMQEEVRRPFDLSTGPLLRIRLLRVQENCHILILTMHHIITDGWSLSILTQELQALYNAFASGRASTLPELPIQYRDFVAWQRTHQAPGLAYWKEQFSPLPPTLSLPTDHPRPTVQTFVGDSHRFQISHTLTQQIQALSQQEDVTLFMTLLAAFLILLTRYSGQEDLVVGTPIANRPRPELEHLIGLFMNILALRADLSGNPTGHELLQRVRALTLEAYSYQEIPFEQVVEAVQPRRDPARSPLFQVLFVLQNTPSTNLDLSELSTRPMEIVPPHSEYDLSFILEENPDGLNLIVEYNTQLFEFSTIESLQTHYQTLLQGLCAQPEAHIQDLPLLTEGTRDRLLYGWNQTGETFTDDWCLHELFAEQARRNPTAIAIQDGTRTLSYQELDRLANQLAYDLRLRGVGPESLVGLCLERSLEQMLGLLAILKAGGAYVPLDPALPAERLTYIFTDAQISLVLTQETLRARLSELPGEIFCLDTERSQLAEHAPRLPARTVRATNVAYVIYTSGSTGRPKGVLVCHRNAVNFSRVTARLYGLGPTDRVLQFNSLSFDTSVEEIFPTWSTGATLVLRPAELPSTFDLFQAWLQEQQITVVDLPTAYWHQWAHELARHPLPFPDQLRLVILGGEEAQPETWRLWRSFTGADVALINIYGPTETTVGATFYDASSQPITAGDIQASQTLEREKIPIGRPLANVRAYILDAALQPVPVGVRGELYLAGAGVTRGYLNHPELTAERFLPDPFSEQAGSRMYRTGDRAHYRTDGQIIYAGRFDQQVKLRGFRIELGEIEHALREQTAIQEAVVLLREDLPGKTQLVAYVQSKAGYEFDPSALRLALKKRLPAYMLPSVILNVANFPLTSNNKINRELLPPPETLQRAEQSTRPINNPPQGPVEEHLAAIWLAVLGIPTVERTESFFEIGGHSLLAMQILAAVREELGVVVSIREFFAAPTLAELASLITLRLLPVETQSASQVDGPPPLIPAERVTDIPLSFAQQRLWFLDQLEGSSATYTIPFVLQLTGPFNLPVFQQSIRELVRRHEVLRTTFSKLQHTPIQCIHLFPTTALQVVDIPETEQPDAVLQDIQAEVQRPFDLASGPLLRTRVLRLSEQKHILIFTMHHIVSDGWSIGIMAHELSTLYNAFIAGRPSPLAELPIQYADFAVWQRTYLQGPHLATHLAYWKQQLAEAATLNLPTDYPRQASAPAPGATTAQQWPLALTEQILALSQQEGVTPFMTLLAGFVALLAYTSGQEDITVGTPVANRPHPELEHLVGFFVNTLALRVDLSGDPTCRQILQRVREVTLDAYEHQDLPFEQIVEAVHPKREPGRSPLFQVLFVFQNFASADLSLTDLEIETFGTHTSTAKFDLSVGLEMQENGLEVGTEYNSALFELTTIQQFHTQYRVLLEHLTANPEAKLSELYQMLSE